jgi:hypothetical protein
VVVLDTNNKGYSFGAGGNAPSAPQSGCNYTWNTTQQVPAIAANWAAVATRNFGVYAYHNDVSLVGFLSEIGSAVSSAISTVETAVNDVSTAISAVESVAQSAGG